MLQELVSYIGVNFVLSKLNINLSHNLYFKMFVFFHNILLAVFSASIFYISYRIMRNIDFFGDFCFTSDILMTRDDFHYITYLFYISKYYEFVDTWIVYLKNRKPSFLQIYHHIGAVINMNNIYVYRVEAGWIFVTFNSFVHTIMYLYYALTTIKIYLPIKKLITTLQILQFVVGLGLSTMYLMYNDTLSETNYQLQMFVNIYLCGLIVLFLNFAQKTYRKSKHKAKNHNTDLWSEFNTNSQKVLNDLGSPL